MGDIPRFESWVTPVAVLGKDRRRGFRATNTAIFLARRPMVIDKVKGNEWFEAQLRG